MVLFTFYRRPTCIFQNRNIEESFFSRRSQKLFTVRREAWHSAKLFVRPSETTVDIYTCVLLILLSSSDTRKPTQSTELKQPSYIYMRITLFPTRGCHISPIQRTSFNNLSEAELSHSILALNHPCECSIRL